MKCVICKKGVLRSGKATVTLERDTMTLVVKNVPAKVCANCGEEYVDEPTTAKILKEAEKEAHAGVQVHIREYASGLTNYPSI